MTDRESETRKSNSLAVEGRRASRHRDAWRLFPSDSCCHDLLRLLDALLLGYLVVRARRFIAVTDARTLITRRERTCDGGYG
jgi:hypothetical protein